ncbi:MAG: tRNA (adenosine(37)-N6)-threonylcarbamoyltransferase complex transferase subunit TsaD [Bacteroidetes bacterium]|nr:MAG: tRNA (adenosine(37)-N6)-threonylcarbamoyltransferase complex transferase subunit TsaD [Bacteroidota bacterium]PIE87670.1 MAG: tRNA (adenosine(37)-N6)-threonylcarbamoyltransferase complex transferase subunit TsaD [Bacteroidota bacterium]
MDINILAIESSCDDTSAAVIRNKTVLSNIIASQDVHKSYGGVVPELASRAHQQNIIPVIHEALKKANLSKNQLHAVAYTRGPGLLGSLLVGASFAKTFALGLGIPLIDVDHLDAHILAHFAYLPGREYDPPVFPFLCLTVSGGHTQIVEVKTPFEMEVVGQTIDDAAGEAFDKVAKIMGLPYPGGPVIDRLAKEGDPSAFAFPHPRVADFDYSFSGLKTSFLYFLRDELKKDPQFIEKNRNDLCASIQKTIVDILLEKYVKAAHKRGIYHLAVAGGVSANSLLQQQLRTVGAKNHCKVYIPHFELTTDNAAMIAIAAYFKYREKMFGSEKKIPYSRSNLK